MATMTDPTDLATTQKDEHSSHEYHADAHVLSGRLERPIEQKIEEHAPVSLKGRRSGHLTRTTEDVSIEGLVTVDKGHTRVSGSKSLKPGHGWVTLSTSMIEGLNVFEIITADRLVSQVSTEHPEKDGHFPHVTFLGTQFNNLQVSGIPLKVRLNYSVCGPKPAGDRSYLDDLAFLEAVKDRTEKVARSGHLPKAAQAEYDKRLNGVNQLIGNKGSKSSGRPNGGVGDGPSVICSLVTDIDKSIEESIPGVHVIGHVLVIPDFGTVSLGEVKVGERWYDPKDARPSNYFELMVIKMNLGCVGTGIVNGGGSSANGHTRP